MHMCTPPLLVVIPMIHTPPRPHDVCHLVQENLVIPPHFLLPFLLHLRLLPLQMQMHVVLWRLVINHRL